MQQGGPGQGRWTAGRQRFQQEQTYAPTHRLQDGIAEAAPHPSSSPPRAAPGPTTPSCPEASKARRARPSVSIRVSSSRTRSRLTWLTAGAAPGSPPQSRAPDRRRSAPQSEPPATCAICLRRSASPGNSDGTYQAGIQVFHSAHEVKDCVPGPSPSWQVRPGSSIMPLMVKSRRFTSSSGLVENRNRVWAPAVRVGSIAAKGCDLGHNLLVPEALLADEDHAEMRTHGKGLLEQGEDQIRWRAGRDVVVVRLAPQQQVAYTTAHEVCVVTRNAQPGHDLRCRILCSVSPPFLAPSTTIGNVSQPSQLLSGAEGGYAPAGQRPDSRHRKLL